MDVGKGTKIWHASIFLSHLINTFIGRFQIVIHVLAELSHSSFNFLNSFLVAIIRLSWHHLSSGSGSKFSLVLSDLFINRLHSSLKLCLHIGCKLLGLLNSLNVLSVFVNSRVLSSFLLLQPLFLSSIFLCFFGQVGFLFSWLHFGNIWEKLVGSCGHSGSLVLRGPNQRRARRHC